jgi:Mrp family chromosome partitioning ATPase
MSDCKPVSIDALSFRIDTSSLPSSPVPKPHISPAPSQPASEQISRTPGAVAPAATMADSSSSVVVANPWDRQDAARNEAPQTLRPSEPDEQVRGESSREPVTNDRPLPIPEANSATGTSFEPPASTMSPVWEVDRFRWPALCDRLIAEEDEYFSHAGQKLLDASRQGLRVLAVTANSAGEGSTTLSICLARAVAAAGAKVALLDGDLPRRQLAMGLGLDLSHGWLDVGSGAVPWVEAAVNSLHDDLMVFPARPLTDQSPITAALDTPRALAEISQNFDLLVLDVGPLTSEACRLLSHHQECAVNAAIVVRDLRKTSEHKTLDVVARLRTLGVRAVGIAENYTSPEAAAAAA